MRALLFLDVDGTLLPFGSDRPYPTYEGPRGLPADHPLLHRVDPALGPRLLGLGCAPVWATTWLDDANTTLAPWLGLPPLPVLDLVDAEEPPRGGRHWKTRPVVARAAGRPFVWVDDEITGTDRAWVAAHHPGPALLHRVDHRYGLTEADFAVVRAWLRDAGCGPEPPPPAGSRPSRGPAR
ncbi:HAD domain-containing protein [Streptomyces sp. NPDC001595]|uniref:HAD domain-containing protein n=1 Tax=Streptomyces sp. NPDC001532 TaxID=3154520 RepID=UPI003324EADA